VVVWLRCCLASTRYNVNSVESHVAIELVSKVAQLMATDEEVDAIAAEGHLTADGTDGVANFAGVSACSGHYSVV
jgi:hypothetical protein